MSNSPKQFHAGYWYHVYARSLEEVPLFVSDDEREWFIEKLDDIFVRRRVSLGALCLMDTHYHALAKMGPVRLDRALNGLHMSYARHINDRRGRQGSVFEKHPGTDIILDDSYLIQLVPYIHNNPVEAGMVEAPGEYEWSTDVLYRNGEWNVADLESWEWPPHFQGDDRTRIYKDRLGEDLDVPRNSEGYIGTHEEWTELEKRDQEDSDEDGVAERRGRESKDEIVRRIVEDHDVTIDELKEPGRDHDRAEVRHRSMVALYKEGYGPTEIGEYFNRHKGTVSYAIRKFEE